MRRTVPGYRDGQAGFPAGVGEGAGIRRGSSRIAVMKTPQLYLASAPDGSTTRSGLLGRWQLAWLEVFGGASPTLNSPRNRCMA
jgi:hypothetical protein